jgi:hypothetical protein
MAVDLHSSPWQMQGITVSWMGNAMKNKVLTVQGIADVAEKWAKQRQISGHFLFPVSNKDGRKRRVA